MAGMVQPCAGQGAAGPRQPAIEATQQADLAFIIVFKLRPLASFTCLPCQAYFLNAWIESACDAISLLSWLFGLVV